MRWFRRKPDPDEVRPRFGRLNGPNGERIPLVFHPDPDRPGNFIGKRADDETPACMAAGWSLDVDAIGAGQSIQLGAEL